MKIKRILAFVITTAMVISIFTSAVSAEETGNEPEETTTVESSEETKETAESKETVKETEPAESKETAEETETAVTDETEPSESSEPKDEEPEAEEPSEPSEEDKADEAEDKTPSETAKRSPKAAIIDGTTGSLKWSYDESTKVLTISGEGAIPDFIWPADRSWYEYQDQVEKIVVEEGVTKIGYDGLAQCANLKRIEVASSVKTLTAFSFALNPKLASLQLPESVDLFGHGLFQDCESLKSVTLPAGAKEIGSSFFTNCKNLTSVTIPEGVTKICFFSFHGCEKLTKIYIPQSLTTIEENALAGCPLLNDIYYDGTESDWNKINIDPNNKGILAPAIHLSDGKVIPSKKSSNTLYAKGKTAKVKYRKLRKKKQTVSRSKVITVKNPKGQTTYSLVSVSKKKYKKYFTINASNGTVSIKKKLRRGTYKIKCRIRVAGNEDYKPLTKTVTFKIKVR